MNRDLVDRLERLETELTPDRPVRIEIRRTVVGTGWDGGDLAEEERETSTTVIEL